LRQVKCFTVKTRVKHFKSLTLAHSQLLLPSPTSHQPRQPLRPPLHRRLRCLITTITLVAFFTCTSLSRQSFPRSSSSKPQMSSRATTTKGGGLLSSHPFSTSPPPEVLNWFVGFEYGFVSYFLAFFCVVWSDLCRFGGLMSYLWVAGGLMLRFLGGGWWWLVGYDWSW